MTSDPFKLTPEPLPDQWPNGPDVAWRPWTAPAALALALLLAAIGGLIIDVPAALLGAHLTGSQLPGELVLADTAAQEVAFVLACVLLAYSAAGSFAPWQLGLRATWLTRGKAVSAVIGIYVAFLLFSVIWQTALHITEKEKLLETLGANEGTLLLVLSALLTCIIAPICEEILFRGYFLRALSNWRGFWPAALITGVVFGAIHAGSAPVVDLVPLGVLGLLLCLLYRASGSLYLCIAVHAINNSIAFGDLEGWNWWQIAAMPVAAISLLWLLARLLQGMGILGADSVAPTCAGAKVP